MSKAPQEPTNNAPSAISIGSFARLLKVLRLTFKDRNVRSSIKELLYHLSSLEESSPPQFVAHIAAWGKRLALLQNYYQPSRTAFSESLVELYPELMNRVAREIAGFQLQPTITIMILVRGGSPLGLEETLRSIQQQFYSKSETYIVTEADSVPEVSQLAADIFGPGAPVIVTSADQFGHGPPSSLEQAFPECRGSFVGFLSAGDRLTRDALFEVVRFINQYPETDIIYSDEELRDGTYFVRAFHKPGWSPDLFLSQDYLRNFLCCRTEVLRAAGNLRSVAEDDFKYDLVLRLIGHTQNIHHIPQVLYHQQVAPESSSAKPSAQSNQSKRALEDHLKRSMIEGTVSDGAVAGTFRVRRNILGRPLVSIIIPTKDKAELLKRCLESIESKTSYRSYEIIVVDNASAESATFALLAKLPHKVIRYPGPFNFSKINNLAAHEAGGSHLLFLNNDTEVIAPEWLEAMLEHSQRPEVGAVGAKLLYPDGTIQHAGIAMEPRHIALHLHKFRGPYDHGYHGLADMVRNLNAVTGACLMTKASVFDEVGGFDETLPLTYNDVDLCLKMRARGYLTVYTPFALLYHHEGISTDAREIVEIKGTDRGHVYRIAVPEGQGEQVKLFYARWKDLIENDSYYVPDELIADPGSE